VPSTPGIVAEVESPSNGSFDILSPHPLYDRMSLLAAARESFKDETHNPRPSGIGQVPVTCLKVGRPRRSICSAQERMVGSR
jgi:hypothetical protein